MISCLLGLFLVNSASADDHTITEMIKDALATNATLVRAGTTTFDVSRVVGGNRPVRAVGTFTWKGDDGLWTYRLTDPDSLVTGRGTYEKGIEEAPLGYRLLAGNRLYSYHASTNSLHISKFENFQESIDSFYSFDLFPKILWDRCCPSFRGQGRLWTEMIGPNSPASQPNSTHEMIQISNLIYRRIRNDPGLGILTTDYSMEFAGHVVASDYQPSARDDASLQLRSEWRKVGRAAVLVHCESKSTTPAGPRQYQATYTAQFDHTDVSTSVPNSKFSFEEFTKLLPRSTIVNDHIINKTYPLHKSDGTPDDLLKALAKKARSSGLSKSKEAKP